MKKNEFCFIRNDKFNSYCFYWETFLAFVVDIKNDDGEEIYSIAPYYCTKDWNSKTKNIIEVKRDRLIQFNNVVDDTFIPIEIPNKDYKSYLKDKRWGCKPWVTGGQLQVLAIYLDKYYKKNNVL